MLRRQSNNTKTNRVPREIPNVHLKHCQSMYRPSIRRVGVRVEPMVQQSCRRRSIKTASDIIPPLHVVSIRSSQNNILASVNPHSLSRPKITAKPTQQGHTGAMTMKSWFFRPFLFPQSRPSRKSHNVRMTWQGDHVGVIFVVGCRVCRLQAVAQSIP